MDRSGINEITGGNAIMIAYHLTEMKPYICLSNFLRLCGFLVVDGRMEGSDTKIRVGRENFEVLIYLGQDTGELEEADAAVAPYVTESGELVDDGEICHNTVSKALEALKTCIEDNVYGALTSIAEIYGKYQLRLQEYNSQYYWYDKDIAGKACEAFKEAEKELFTLSRTFEKDADRNMAYAHIQYARCYCVRRVTEMETTLKNGFQYDIVQVVAALKKIYDEFPRFVTAASLIGYLLEARKGHREEAIEWYQKFLAQKGKEICSSEIYYRLGKKNENAYRYQQAFLYYKNAYDLNRQNYRALYKIGEYHEFQTKNYSDAIKVYKKIISYLERVKNSGGFQPIELEYLFKCYFRVGRIYLKHIQDFAGAIEYFRKEEELAKIQLSEMSFMSSFYGGDAEQYLRCTVRRFPMHQVRINQEASMEMNPGGWV